MYDFLKFVTVDLFVDGWTDISRGDWWGIVPIVMGLMIILLIVMVISLIIFFIYEAIDTSVPTTPERGTVTSKRHVPAHVTMVYNAATKTSTPIYHPPRWYAAFSVKGAHEELYMTQNVFNRLQHGDQMNVLVTQGKLSKRKRIVGYAA